MADPKQTISQAYKSFNRRDIDSALTLMTEDVSWPKASEGGSVTGKEAIRAYWMRQWSEFDPHVEPLAIAEQPSGEFRVTVHQVVRSLHGELLSDGEVTHMYTLRDGLIAAMHLGDATAANAPTAAFAHRS